MANCFVALFAIAWNSIVCTIVGILIWSCVAVNNEANQNDSLVESTCVVFSGHTSRTTCDACSQNSPQRRAVGGPDGGFYGSLSPTVGGRRQNQCTTHTYTCYVADFQMGLRQPGGTLLNATTTMPNAGWLGTYGCTGCMRHTTALDTVEEFLMRKEVQCFYDEDDPAGTVVFEKTQASRIMILVYVIVLLVIICCFGGAGVFVCMMGFCAPDGDPCEGVAECRDCCSELCRCCCELLQWLLQLAPIPGRGNRAGQVWGAHAVVDEMARTDSLAVAERYDVDRATAREMLDEGVVEAQPLRALDPGLPPPPPYSDAVA